jgi:hypothetical protein
LAADRLCYALNKSTTIDEVEVALNVHYDNRSQLEIALYKKVQGLCSNFKTASSLPTASPTSSQPIPVPQAITSKSVVSVPNTSLRRETKPSPGHETTEARRDQEALSDASQMLPGGTSEAGVQADYPISTLASSCPGVLAVRSAVNSKNSAPNTFSTIDPVHSPALAEARREQVALNNTSQRLPEGTPRTGVQADYPISITASSCPGVLASPSKRQSSTSVPHTSSRIHPESSRRDEPTEATQEQVARDDASHRLPEGTPEAELQTDYPNSIISSSSPAVLAVHSAVKSSNSVPKTSSKIDPEPFPQYEPTEARQEQEVPNNASQRLREGTPEAGLVADQSTPTTASSCPVLLAVPVTLPLESSRIFKERELFRNGSEADFGEKDPVSVYKRSLDSLLAQNIPSDPYTPCTLTSSMSTVENGLGWVIQGAFLQVRSTEECEPCLEVVAQAVELFPCPQVLGADAATEVRNQKGLARTRSSEALQKTFEPPVQTQVAL